MTIRLALVLMLSLSSCRYRARRIVVPETDEAIACFAEVQEWHLQCRDDRLGAVDALSCVTNG